jgi:hypothetical protein
MSAKEDIEFMCRLLKSNKVYYQTVSHLPQVDKDGRELFSKMKVDNILDVWLMHPDLLPQFEQIVQTNGKNPVEFDLARYLSLPKPDLHANSFPVSPCQ